MREGMVLYDARRAARSGPAQRRLARRRRRRPSSSGAGEARQIFEQGGDWVSITSPAALPLDQGARARDLRADRPRRHAQRLGPLSPDRPVRHRPVVRFELEPVRPARANVVRRRRSSSSACRPRSCPRSSSPAPSSGRVDGPRRPTRPACAAGTPVVVGGADTQLGLVGIGVVAPGPADAPRRQLLAAHGRHRRAAHRSRRPGSARSATRCPGSG